MPTYSRLPFRFCQDFFRRHSVPPARWLKASVIIAILGMSVDSRADSTCSIIQSGPNHNVWQGVTASTNASGQLFYRTNRYTELATGMNHLVNGQWVPSVEQIQITQTGAVATNCQHQVYFMGNLNTPGAVHLVTPEGLDMQSHIAGLAYYDSSLGQSVMIAELQDTLGQVLPSGNQALYTNAFTDIDVDVRYSVTQRGLEQDIILREQLPSPTNWNFNPQTTVLQVWTEFTQAPVPTIQASATVPASGLLDQNLSFGMMQMGHGKAFSIGDEDALVPVAKHWNVTGGRTFLVEEVLLNALTAQIQALPAPGNANGTNASSGGQQSSSSHSSGGAALYAANHPVVKDTPSWPRNSAKKTLGAMRMAKANIGDKGLVLDYLTINGSLTNYVFQSDTTYYLTNEVDLYGTTTIEGGTVVKFSKSSLGTFKYGVLDNTSASLVLQSGSIVWGTGQYRPAVFTAQDDNTIGETLGMSTGVPGTNYYGHLALNLYWATNSTVSNVRFSYLFDCVLGSGILLKDAQAVNCAKVFDGGVGYFVGGDYAQTCCDQMENCLLYQVGIVADISPNGAFGNTLYAQNVTAHDCGTLMKDGTSTIYLTNCLFVNLTNWSTLYKYTNSMVILTNDSGVFQAIGAGYHYLANTSLYRNAGTTNIDPALLSDLAQKTTWAPVVYLSTTITSNLVLSPEVPRDTNGTAVDLGYHYDPLDFAFGQVWLGSNVTVTVSPGTALGCFGTNEYMYGYGIGVGGGAQFICQGAPTAPNWIAAYNMVQEQCTTNWSEPYGALVALNFVDYSSFLINCRFTSFSVAVLDAPYLYNITGENSGLVVVRDCEFHGGALETDAGTANFTNCLFERTACYFTDATNEPVVILNNLFWNSGGVGFTFVSTNSVVKNNMFYQSTIQDHSSTNYACGCNGYYATGGTFLTLTNSLDEFLTVDPGYQVGPLGNYYLSGDNATLIHLGNTNANLLGMYHYCITTNEVKEATNIVSIGYHYIALDANGRPVSTSGDGIGDYLKDSNGDGAYSGGDLGNWLTNCTSGDGINDYIKYIQGRNLNVSGSLSDSNGITALKVYTPLK